MSHPRHLPLALLGMLLLQQPAVAQDGDAEAAPSELAERLADIDAARKARRSNPDHALRHRINRYMQAAAESIDESNVDEARALLDKLNLERLNVHERARVHRLKAFVAYTAGDGAAAIQEFKNAVAQEILPIRDDVRMRYNVAQLYASLHQWPETIQALNEWFEWEADPEPRAYYLLAIAHFQLDKFDEAIGYAEKAIDLSPSPQEGWLQLLAALYIQKEDYASATPVLEELVLLYPKRIYWVQLSLIYGARDEYQRSLAVQQVAHAQGLLIEDKEIRRLTRSYLHADLPYPAAQLLQSGLEEGLVEADQKSYELLANSWIASREYDKSLEPLRQAAELSEDGNLFVRLGQVYLQREEWGQAAATFERALTKGELKKPGNALLLIGISSYNDGLTGKARSYFVKARQHEDTRPQAENWLKHLENEALASQTGEEVATAEGEESPEGG